MAKQDKNVKPGFVIKLSCETVQKLSEEGQKFKSEEKPVSSDSYKEDIQKKIYKNSESNESQQEESNINHVNIDGMKDSKTEGDKTETVTSGDNTDDNSTKQEIDGNSTKQETGGNSTKQETDCTNPSWGEYAPYVTYESETAIYTDPTNKQKYAWNTVTNSWDPKGDNNVPDRVYSYENDTHIYTEADGSKFFWDADKKAWIPKVDDDFLAYYQMSYGFIDNDLKDSKKDESQKQENVNKIESTGVKRKNEPQWFEPSDDKNTKVYVSNLPLDLTEEEFVDLMQKCGLVERDPSSQKMKIKLYMDKEHNCFKGDALCTYIKIESVDLALKLIDGSIFKGNKIKVEKAHFELKGEYNPALKPKKKKKKELEKIKKMQQKLFDWRPEKFIGERSKHERIVIVKNLFHPSDFDKEVQLILDYQQDLREESAKCGDVRKVVIYDRHPEGVAQITMKEPEQADAVVQLINGRWFGKRQITAEIWDGRTKYRIAETDADINTRIDKWEKFLEEKDDGDKGETVIDKTTTDALNKDREPVESKQCIEVEKDKNSVQ